jgi:HEAT repeat protein
VAAAGHTGDEATARTALRAPEPGVRATALAALDRLGALTDGELDAALSDPSPRARRRACELAGRRRSPQLAPGLVERLGDEAPEVVEAAAAALGELPPSAIVDPEVGEAPWPTEQLEAAVTALSRVAVGHDDPLCREAAVAALGALGHPAGLAAVLSALGDRLAVRRRAVVALAAFEGREADEALEVAARSRDWQARQAAEDVLGRRRPRR